MKTKKIMVVIMSVVLVMCLMACQKQQTEENISVWDAYDWEKVGGFTMEGNNLSPIKEIGANCKKVCVRIDEYTSEKPVLLYVRLEYDESQRIIGNTIAVPPTDKGNNIIVVGSVKKGDHIRVFTQVFEEDGNYDPNLECTLSYSYILIK